MARAGAHGFVGASLIAIATCSAGHAHAHGGGLDKHGCHHDRKRGGYHCHRGSASPPPPSTFDTTPARGIAPSNLTPARTPAGGRAFANCTEARVAGAAPVRRGDPGYGAHLDRDGDGVGCEPRRR
jgi:hypothetical protein